MLCGLHLGLCRKNELLSCLVVVVCPILALGQIDPYPHNAVTCEHCHNTPSKFGASPMTVQRMGASLDGTFLPSSEGGIHHRNGESALSSASGKPIAGDRIAVNLLGDGYIEAIDSRDIEQNAQQQRDANLGVAGVVVSAPVLEARVSSTKIQVGRFGWKSQHSSLMSSCADSLRNELGMRNRLYPDEYATRAASDSPTPFDTPNDKTHKTELESLVDEIRHTDPPPHDPILAASPTHRQERNYSLKSAARFAMSQPTKLCDPECALMAAQIKSRSSWPMRSSILTATSYCTMSAPATESRKPPSPTTRTSPLPTKFRIPPLWGLRFRYGLMHDGNSAGTEAAIISLLAKPARNGVQTRFL